MLLQINLHNFLRKVYKIKTNSVFKGKRKTFNIKISHFCNYIKLHSIQSSTPNPAGRAYSVPLGMTCFCDAD